MSDPDDYVLGGVDISVPIGRIARQMRPEVTDELIKEAVTARYARFEHALRNIETETLAGLRRLRKLGLRLSLISNCGEDEVRPWPESPLAEFFPTPVFSCVVGLKKPYPRIYLLALDALGLEAGECLYVGNGGSQELVGASAVGMTPVLLTRHLEAINPARIVEVARDAQYQVRTVGELADRLAAGRSQY